MRLADLVVDLAAVLNASRSVASKHAALRAQQLDRYNRSSAVVAALRRRPAGETRPVALKESGQAAAPGTGNAPPAEGDDGAGKDGVEHDFSAGAVSRPDAPLPHIQRLNGVTEPINRQGVAPPGRVHVLPGNQRSASLGDRTGEAAAFKPAPWANLSGLANQPKPRPIPPQPSSSVPKPKTLLGNNDSIPSGVDLNVFRTGRGATILEVPVRSAEGERSSVADDLAGAMGRKDENPGADALEPPRNPASGLDTSPQLDRPPLDDRQTGGRPIPSDQDVSLGEVQPPATQPPNPEEDLSQRDLKVVEELRGVSPSAPAYQLRESKVPASRMSRLWNYSGLAAGMFAGAISESISRAAGGGGEGSVMLSAGNMERLVAKLSRMRGAALKLGQMMSFQDSKMLPGPIQEVLQRVQDRADYMPQWQRDRVLTEALGAEWRDLFGVFEEKPIAAASIGQVHRATLRSSGTEVAVKVQFPGVADSINSDLDNLGILLAATRLLPKGLYLNKTIDNARTELAWECDYEREAECGQRYRQLLAGEEDVFVVPRIYPEASGKQVLTMEYMRGIGVTRVQSFTQEQRDWIGTHILRLCLREITEFRFMQTDPNWTNFLYNAETNKLELLDFGASREYPEHFITLYVRLLEAASRSDRAAVRDLSEQLGYLTGHESKAMLDAHTASVLTLAEPFLRTAPEVYDFRDQTITDRVKSLIPVMIRERLAPPPEETYSLHRKLSGAFLLCARLGSRVRCRELFEESLKKSALDFSQE